MPGIMSNSLSRNSRSGSSSLMMFSTNKYSKSSLQHQQRATPLSRSPLSSPPSSSSYLLDGNSRVRPNRRLSASSTSSKSASLWGRENNNEKGTWGHFIDFEM